MSIVSDVVEINRECFTSDDKYSSEKYLSSLLDVGVRILTVKQVVMSSATSSTACSTLMLRACGALSPRRREAKVTASC